jgi:cellobiose transport system substrate-binding protein
VGASTTRRRARRLAALLLATSALLAAGIAASGAGAASGAEKITLRVDLFGDFGYHDLYKQFMKSHPNVTIKEDIESYADHHSNLAKHLATGSGADDVVAIEVGFIAQFAATPQYFVDLGDYWLD